MIGQEEMASLSQLRFKLELEKNFFMEKIVRHWEKSAQGSGGITDPGNVPKLCRCGA